MFRPALARSQWRAEYGSPLAPPRQSVSIASGLTSQRCSTILAWNGPTWSATAEGGLGVLALATRQPELVRTLTVVGATHTWDEPIRQRIRDLVANVEADPGLID